jgi:transcriptional regulator with PAS, ATPase and Fis domain
MKLYTAKDYLTGELNLLLMEKITIEKALKKSNNNQIKAAELLKVSVRTVSTKIKQHQIKLN